jgi:RNA polymerase sigma factor (sigma-70 family)
MTESDHTTNQHALYWIKICEDFMQRLIAYALRLANGRSYDADDLVQETVLHALNCSKNPAEVKKPVGYLLRIMRNIWITRWRSENTANTESLDELQSAKALKNHPTVDPEVFRILENQEFAEAMRVFLRSLTPREMRLLKLYLKGYKCHEIAHILSEDVRLTRSDLNSVRTKVQQRIKRKGKQPGERHEKAVLTNTSSPQNYKRGT